jgi:uncharacterized delta-60 repeat protein
MSAGDLDPTFGTGGKYLPNDPDLPPAFILPTDFAVQGDGKVLVTGFGVHDIGTVFRLTADGKIDPAFAGGNVLAGSGQGGYWAQAMSVAVGSNGRIVVAGHDGGMNDDRPTASTLVVYKADGSIDKTFDADGVIDTTAFGAGFVDVAFQADGKILALGKKLVRFNADGSVDKTFGGGDGVIDVDGRKLVLDGSGRIVVLGQNALFRYTISGSPDATFDGEGIRPSVKGYDLALAPDGDLIVIGNGGNNDQLSRFNADGSVDDAFGHHGNLFAPGGRTLAVDAKNIFVGSSPGSPVMPFSDFTVDAYTQTGQRDASFGSAGRVQTDFALTWDTMVGLAFQQGKLLALGYADVNLDAGGTQSEPALARYQLSATTTPTRSPFNGVPVNVTDGVSAVQFDTGGEGVAYHDTESQNLGGAYRPNEGVDIQYTGDAFHPNLVSFVKAGEWLEYTVNVTETATYDIDVLAAHLKNGGRFHLAIDGKDVTGPLTVPNTGSWTTFRNVQKRGVALTAGTHVLRLAFDANGDIGYVGNFDKLVFNKVVAPGPQSPFYPTPGKDGQRFEFEDYDRGGEGVAFHDTDNLNQGDYGGRPADGVDIQSASEGGENVGFLKAGEWLEYTMDFTQSGPVAIDVRAASQGPGGSFGVQVDGVTVATYTMTDTGGWQSYRTLTKRGLNITQGRHVVRFQMTANGSTGYVANLNWFEFRKA